jgi:glycosyltransferase involved in cell wall biosynthesis
MSDKNLVVIYGENDPQRNDIFELAEWAKNIDLLTLPGNEWFTDYVGKCIATIYIPVDEDFGMSPVESMAAGKPVLWVDEWWLKESLIHKKTSYLISPEAKIDEIVEAVDYLSKDRCIVMRQDCELRAQDFGLKQFAEKLKLHI